jgi:hypothetical protein
VRIGYSLLLGEHVMAVDLIYSDCRSLQVVCPACKEPLFKGERARDSEGAHYLSHYSRDRSFVEECELRVAAIASKVIADHTIASRGQRLQLFLRVLQDELVRSTATDASAEVELRRKHALSRRSACLRWLSRQSRDALAGHRFSCEQFNEYADNYVADAGLDLPAGSFSVATQKRTAFDVYQHLLSPAAFPSFEFVYRHAAIVLYERVLAAGCRLEPWQAALTILLFGGKRRGIEVLTALRQVSCESPFASDLTQFGKLLAEIQHELNGALLRVPYLDILRRERAAA